MDSKNLFGDIFTPITPDDRASFRATKGRARRLIFFFEHERVCQIGYIRKAFFRYQRISTATFSRSSTERMKPEAKIYEVVERETNAGRLEILYVDDRPREYCRRGKRAAGRLFCRRTPEKKLGRRLKKKRAAEIKDLAGRSERGRPFFRTEQSMKGG